MKKEKYIWEHFMALYSNLALHNAVKYTQMQNNNKDVKENNFENSFLWNKAFQNAIKKAQKKDEINFEEKDLGSKICQYLRNIRNFYSHTNNEKQKSNDWINQNEENINENLKSIFNKTSQSPIVQNFSKHNWRIFIICIFLTKIEYNNLLLNIENDIELKDSPIQEEFIKKLKQKSSIFKKMRFRLRQVHRREDIHIKVLNYITSFKKTRNNKNAFIKVAISLLNWKFKNLNLKNLELKFSLFAKNKYLIQIESIKKRKTFLINFYTLSKLLLFNIKELVDFINKIFNNEHYKLLIFKKSEKSEINDNNNFNAFLKRYEESSQIDDRHLLKTFHKIINYEDQKKDKNFSFFTQNNFEKIYQSLVSGDEKLISNTKFIVDKFNLTFNCNKEEWIGSLKNNIKKYILKEIDDEKKFIKLFKKNSNDKINISNVPKVKNDKLLFLENEDKINYSLSYELFLDLENIKNNDNKKELNTIKTYIAPIVAFYNKIFNDIIDKKTLNVEDLIKNEQDLIIDKDIIKKIFNNKIEQNKNEITFEYLNKKTKIDAKYLFSNYEILNSKLFWEIYILLEKEKKDKQLIIEEVLGKYDWYWKNELFLIKKVISWDQNKEKQNYKYRNYIFHRSLSKFNNWTEIENLLNNNKNYWMTKNSQNNKQSNSYIKNNNNFKLDNNFDKEIQKFNEDIEKYK